MYYLYEDGNDIDFITSDGLLIESKFNSRMTDKQQALFDRTGARYKMVIDSVGKLKMLDSNDPDSLTTIAPAQ